MKYLDELKTIVKEVQQQMTQAKKSELANAIDEVSGLNQEFSFAARMLKGSLAKGCKKK